MANKNGKPTYAGKISNSGNQVVKPLFAPKKRSGDTKHTGNDLRTGETGKKSK